MALSSIVDNPMPQLKEFQIEKRLGTGTYANVYKAINKSNNEISAIKCIKKNGLNKTSTENLLREIKILKEIKHDFIVQLKNFQWDENYIYLIMEYCAGGDLSAFIKSRRTIPEKYVRRFVQQIACALKHLHSKGIAHMDLKPQNILLTSANNPSLKLADFGFAQYMREDKFARSLRGSPLYMAPEILKCKKYDNKVDLWSVGVILHEVIFGYAPFVSNSLDELERKILDDTPIQIPSHVMLSETCKDLLKRLLQRSPNERITFEQFFNHPFVDLDHMASNQCFPKASELLNKAVRADERRDYILSQRYYLQSIEYLIPAIQFEKDHQKKQEIREKAKIYLKRAEEIAVLIKPENKAKDTSRTSNFNENHQKFQSNTPNTQNNTFRSNSIRENLTNQNDLYISNILPLNQTTNATSNISCNNNSNNTILSCNTFHTPNVITTNPTTSSLTCVSSLDFQQTNGNSNYQQLLKYFDGNEDLQKAIKMCLDADEKHPNSLEKYDELFNQYHAAISIMLPYAKSLKKDNEAAKLLKYNIDKWLSKAENIKEKYCEFKNNIKLIQANNDVKEDDENIPYYKHCSIS